MKYVMTICSALLLVACGDDGGTTEPQPLGQENRPSPGAQVDRMGRAAINTALNFQFIPDKASRDMKKDAWNKASSNTEWQTFVPEMRVHLLALDALDKNCGNQFAYGTPNAGDEYKGLAEILAEDVLWLDASVEGSGAYLGIEAGLADNQGGRRPADDVIDVSYSVLSGAFDLQQANPFPVSDGVDSPGDKAPTTDFPYLAAP